MELEQARYGGVFPSFKVRNKSLILINIDGLQYKLAMQVFDVVGLSAIMLTVSCHLTPA